MQSYPWKSLADTDAVSADSKNNSKGLEPKSLVRFSDQVLYDKAATIN